MAGELLIQVFDIGQFRAIRPALDELDSARALGSESRAVLREAATSPFARSARSRDFASLVGRILRHPELELRVFLAPRELDDVIEGVVRALCLRNEEFTLSGPEVGPSWVLIDSAYPAFMHLDWFDAIFLKTSSEAVRLAYPRHCESWYCVLSRDDVARLAAGSSRRPALRHFSHCRARSARRESWRWSVPRSGSATTPSCWSSISGP